MPAWQRNDYYHGQALLDIVHNQVYNSRYDHEGHDHHEWHYHYQQDKWRLNHDCAAHERVWYVLAQAYIRTDIPLTLSRKPLRRQADLRQPVLRFGDQLPSHPISARQPEGQSISSRQHRHLCVAVRCTNYTFKKAPKLTLCSDTAAKVPTVDTYLADIKAKNAAGASPPIMGAFVVYDLPNRDCAALASNGEYTLANDGLNKYYAYVDSIAAILKKYPDVPVSLVIGKP